MGDDKNKFVYVGDRPLNLKTPTLKQGAQNLKNELGRALDWMTGKKKKKKPDGTYEE